MQSTKGDVAFSIDSLLEQPEKLSERGVTELYLHDEALSKDRKKIIQVLELLSQKDSPFVSILTNVQTIDRELAQKAADSLCSLEIPLAASVKGEALLFDKHLFAKKAGEFSQKTPRTSELAPIPAAFLFAKYTKRDE